MHITRGCLVVPIQVELHDQVIQAAQADILEQVRRSGLRGVVIDVSGVSMIDRFMADRLAETARMASLLGATTVLTGLKPGVVTSLIDLGFEVKNFLTAISLEEGLRTPRNERRSAPTVDQIGWHQFGSVDRIAH